MIYCCVPNCSSCGKRNPELSFHSFPKAGPSKFFFETKPGNKELVDRKRLWIRTLKIDKKVSNNMRVCSLHFAESDFLQKVRVKRRTLKIHAIPSRNLPEVKRLNKTPKLDQKRSATLCVKPKQRINLNKTEVKEPLYNSYHGKSFQRIELHDDVKYKEIRELFSSTLANIKIMTQKVESYVRPTNVATKSQSDIFYEDISLLENSIQDVKAILSNSLIITDNDYKCVKKEYIADEISVLKSENSNLTKEMGMLIAKIAKLEAEIESSQVQPQTIIYNPRDTPTILLVTNDF